MQRSEEWFNVRLGRFTGSRISELLGIKGLNQLGENYAFEMASEIVFGRDEEESFVSYDMMRGIELEPLAFKKFAELKSYDFIDVQKCDFFVYGKNAGASPDGLVGKDAVLEIKCPKPKKFFKHILNGIKEIDSKYIDQMQMEMLVTNSIQCHFFNYIIYNGVEMWNEIIVPRDEVRIDLIKNRIDEAVILRDKFVEQLINNKQF